MTSPGRYRFLACTLLLVAACSGSADTVPTTSGTDRDRAPAESTAPTTPTTTVAEPSTSAPPTTLVSGVDFGLGQIEVTTPASGGGTRPELAWEPVDGAQQYRVTVFTPDGGPYWATQTDAVRVHVGGEPQLNEDAAGPSISSDMTWRVVALDDDRRPLAISERMPLSP